MSRGGLRKRGTVLSLQQPYIQVSDSTTQGLIKGCFVLTRLSCGSGDLLDRITLCKVTKVDRSGGEVKKCPLL